MKTTLIPTLLQLAVWTVLGTIASAQAQAHTASVPQVQPAPKPQVRYDFAYTVADNRIQVFDDGSVTRIALPDGTLAPTVIAVRPGGEVLLVPRRDPPNLVFDGIHARLVLRWANGREVVATYKGSNHMSERNGTPAAFGAVLPAASYGVPPAPVVYSAAPTPVGTEPPTKVAGIVDGEAVVIPVAKPAAVLPIAPLAKPAPDPAVMDSAVAVPAPVSVPTLETQAVTASVAPVWNIYASDGSLSKALGRWSRGKTPIAWEADKDFPAIQANYTGNYLSVIEQVMRDTERSQYPLHACVYDNVIRILHVTQSCKR